MNQADNLNTVTILTTQKGGDQTLFASWYDKTGEIYTILPMTLSC